ncbi:MAG: BON domain-containing protein [Balneolaceae bacterium]|nr:BON domain-containing protein [Balneolaceae bacterium]
MLALFLSLFLILNVVSCREQERPTRELPSDEEITESIATQLGQDAAIQADQIDVKTRDGIATLTGDTGNLLAKRKAEKIAESAFGVLAVVNNISVTAERPDELVEDDILDALASNPATENIQIETEVNNGSVTLKGLTDSWAERRLTEKIVAGVKGVKEIRNNLIVQLEEARPDSAIAKDIKQSLLWDNRIGDAMIKVEVDDGNVSLSGAVGSAREKTLAMETAQLAGVEAVEADLLEVHPEYQSMMFQNSQITGLTTDQIRKAIIRSLQVDPRVDAEQVNVQIKDDVVILTGTVPYLSNKLAAGEDARNTAGVSRVENNIDVNHKVVVQPEADLSDSAIKNRIVNAMLRDPYIEYSEQKLQVRVNDGVAILEGTVESQFEMNQIEEIIADVKGVITLKNQMKIAEGNNS